MEDIYTGKFIWAAMGKGSLRDMLTAKAHINLWIRLQNYRVLLNIEKAPIILQSTPVISNSKGFTETLRDIRTSTYQSWESEENNKLNNHI